MSNNNIIYPSLDSSMSKVSIQDIPSSQFGYNPAVGAASTEINSTTSSILINKNVTMNTSKIMNKKLTEVNLSSLSFLFCEIVNWCQKKSKGTQDLENRLNGLGYQIGQKYLELTKLREGLKYSKREITIVEILQFIHSSFWRGLFGKIANELEKSQDVNDEYMIIDNCPLISKFINVPKDYGDLSCSAFIAGIIEGALDSSGFYTTVTAHSMPKDEHPLRTVFLIKFDQLVILRDEQRSR